MNKDKKIQILQNLVESLEREIDKLKTENMHLKDQLSKEQSIVKEGHERTKVLQAELEQAIAEYRDLTRECRTLRNDYENNLLKMNKLRKQFRWSVIKAKV